MASDRELKRMKLPAHVRSRAAKIAESPEETRKLVDKAMDKAKTVDSASGPIASVIEDLATMFKLLKAVAKRSYKLRKETLFLIAGAVLYFVIPTDVIPDFIPVAGYLDDAAVIAWVIKACKSEIDRFRSWKANRSAEPESEDREPDMIEDADD